MNHRGLLATAIALAAALSACNPATDGPDGSTPTQIDAADYFPVEAGRMWQFQVEGAGSELGYTFMRISDLEELEGGITAWPMTVSVGAERATSEIESIVYLSTASGWVNLIGEQDPATGEVWLYSAPVALGQAAWKPGTAVSTDAEIAGGSESWSAELVELADRQVYYGTFSDAAHVTVDSGGAANPLAGDWWWGHAVGPIHYAAAAGDSFAMELVYYE